MTDTKRGSLFSLDSPLAVLAPSVRDALASKGNMQAAFSEMLRRESPGCLSLPLLSDEFTNELRQNLTALAAAEARVAAALDSVAGLNMSSVPGFSEFAAALVAVLEPVLRGRSRGSQRRRLHFEKAVALRYRKGVHDVDPLLSAFEPSEDLDYFPRRQRGADGKAGGNTAAAPTRFLVSVRRSTACQRTVFCLKRVEDADLAMNINLGGKFTGGELLVAGRNFHEVCACSLHGITSCFAAWCEVHL